ncbi:hypothetical protein CEE37_13260 [candidate division LCP-89 bacterium B3_LCP]|uniref:Uncharacterized protein n=1 Tax=candidate division LCP-89 bacterium B3_LCP TaxID=2012998 RepID=A0A532USY6_UNCL8|nr:MAG: hypothetical protein CEE37_13260 [candidate division LCP-89 bacterium B3_LCP]
MRNMIFLSLILVLVALGNCKEPDFFGYFEPQLMTFYSHKSDDWALLNSNKLRLDIEVKPGKKVKFGANVNFYNYYGTTAYNLLDYLSPEITAIAQPHEQYYEFAYKDSIELDNVYLRMSFQYADVTVGIQQISYGTGYAWNPTDIFNRKDVLDPTYEQPGHNAVRFDVPLNRNVSMMVIYAPGDNWNVPTALLRLKARLGRFDFSFCGTTTPWKQTFYPVLGYREEERILVGGDLVGQLMGLGVWIEGAYNHMQLTEDFWEMTAGLDYTLRNELYILGEIYYHSEASSSSDDYTLNDWMSYFSGLTRTIGQSQAYVFIQYPITDLIHISSSIIGCINDESVALVPQLNYSLFQDVELTVFGNLYMGNEGTMYSKDLGNGGQIRLRVYF